MVLMVWVCMPSVRIATTGPSSVWVTGLVLLRCLTSLIWSPSNLSCLFFPTSLVVIHFLDVFHAACHLSLASLYYFSSQWPLTTLDVCLLWLWQPAWDKTIGLGLCQSTTYWLCALQLLKALVLSHTCCGVDKLECFVTIKRNQKEHRLYHSSFILKYPMSGPQRSLASCRSWGTGRAGVVVYEYRVSPGHGWHVMKLERDSEYTPCETI